MSRSDGLIFLFTEDHRTALREAAKSNPLIANALKILSAGVGESEALEIMAELILAMVRGGAK